MKRYLFGLGAMIVGAGLMFVLMHGEVSAGRGNAHCEDVGSDLQFCKVRNLTCVATRPAYSMIAISCVKS